MFADYDSRVMPILMVGGWLTFEFMPEPMLFVLLLLAMLLDFTLGVWVALKKGVAIKEEGINKTVEKLILFAAAILGVWILANVLHVMNYAKLDYSTYVNYTIAFIIMSEIYSVMKNARNLRPESPLSKFVLTPVLDFLEGKLKRNIFNKEGKDEEQDL